MTDLSGSVSRAAKRWNIQIINLPAGWISASCRLPLLPCPVLRMTVGRVQISVIRCRALQQVADGRWLHW